MIPKILHLHWFGSAPIPDAYVQNINRWMLLVADTDWHIRLWTDESTELEPLRSLLSDRGAKPVQISNVFRCYQLYVYGGLYLDLDIIPLRLPQFERQDVLNLFYEVSWDTGMDDSTGEKIIIPNNAYMASPPKDRHILDVFWKTLQQTPFDPKTLSERKTAGVGIFRQFDKEWFSGIVKRNVNNFAPVNWAQARTLTMVEKYTYDDWVRLAESFLKYDNVYGVHTFDSSWVFDFNQKQLAKAD